MVSTLGFRESGSTQSDSPVCKLPDTRLLAGKRLKTLVRVALFRLGYCVDVDFDPGADAQK